MRRLPFTVFSAACVGLVIGSFACDDRTRTRTVPEPFTIVPGTPGVDTKTPTVLFDDAGSTDNFGINVPRQCDLFRQLSVRKVDILWVIDSSGSMAPKQERLAQQFNAFINQLVIANPPIDFHIAVISTDTDDPLTRGELRTWTLNGFTGNYIACSPLATGGVSCNTQAANTDAGTSSAVSAFDQMGRVGTSGSAQERGLYAAYLALTNPVNISGATEKFVRQDAALYVVFVTDEDDSSCTPLTRQAICTADPGCRCANDNTLN
ncbi:MAG: VWA domain-containing protein, partial [Myxococcaceae bacterium]|nr:VWA domain-containing protein [Myxococcaceae bacterium]